ncbi:hypothetical protein [Niabella ginsengisoli]|uniref:Lipocalin-like domain-containing protein n=1 Tax=Niabella ginsengisoli TaxID=522298 RepID=A0ABS9SQS4_9BACT|nr:hypothetical protein [Niabella ginsengisoli]MCH5600748.1 hypothetical protein [Niabella ginsengisoli]
MRNNGSENLEETLEGAWSLSYNGEDFSMLLKDGYCMFTQYSLAEKNLV